MRLMWVHIEEAAVHGRAAKGKEGGLGRRLLAVPRSVRARPTPRPAATMPRAPSKDHRQSEGMQHTILISY
jgi:hypothetical protein